MGEGGTVQGIQPGGIWRFGVAVLHETTLILEGNWGQSVLDRSAYQVLRSLLLHAGEVVTKDELLHVGWTGRVVLDNSLMKAISRLRRALGPTGETLLCSVHGYGYRITVPAHYEPPAPGALRKNDPAAFHMPGWRISRMLAKSPDLAVLLAEREDGTASARAFKLDQSPLGLRSLKREVALHGYIQRLRLEPPGLLPLLDWNLTEPPFWVCTHYCVEGSLSQWRTDAGGIAELPMDQRLRMFTGLCRTIAELHGLGILHKDIKPQNLFPVVGPDGYKLLLGDLGISGGDLPPGMAASGLVLGEATMHEAAVLSGTALYTAPEVLAGHSPTTRSDLYALGVLLFQMVTGDLRRSIAPGWEEQVPDELLRDDIAWAANGDPEKRLGDATLLADRLDALEDRRIEAQVQREQRGRLAEQEAELYRSAQRRGWMTGISLILLVGLATTAWMYRRTVLAEHRATEQAQIAVAVQDFLTQDILAQADPFSGSGQPLTLRDAVIRAGEKAGTRFGQQPKVAAVVHRVIGQSLLGLEAGALATVHMREALAADQSAYGPDSAEVAQDTMALCTAVTYDGELTNAAEYCKSARLLLSRTAPDNLQPDIFLGQIDVYAGRFKNAIARFSAIESRVRAGRDQDQLTLFLWFSGLAFQHSGNFKEAGRRYLEMEALCNRIYGKEHVMSAWALTQVASIDIMQGRDQLGRAKASRAMKLFDAATGSQNAQVLVPRYMLATLHMYAGDWHAVQRDLEPALRLHPVKSASTQFVIQSHVMLAMAEAQSGRLVEARQRLNEAEPLLIAIAEARGGVASSIYTTLGSAHVMLDDINRAGDYLSMIRSQAQARHPQNPLWGVGADCLEAEIAGHKGDKARQQRLAQSCLESTLSVYGNDAPVAQWPRRLLADSQ